MFEPYKCVSKKRHKNGLTLYLEMKIMPNGPNIEVAGRDQEMPDNIFKLDEFVAAIFCRRLLFQKETANEL